MQRATSQQVSSELELCLPSGLLLFLRIYALKWKWWVKGRWTVDVMIRVASCRLGRGQDLCPLKPPRAGMKMDGRQKVWKELGHGSLRRVLAVIFGHVWRPAWVVNQIPEQEPGGAGWALLASRTRSWGVRVRLSAQDSTRVAVPSRG